jgi:hypothetical protein
MCATRELIPGSKIIDNHLIIDLCRSVFEMASDEYEYLRKAIVCTLLLPGEAHRS